MSRPTYEKARVDAAEEKPVMSPQAAHRAMRVRPVIEMEQAIAEKLDEKTKGLIISYIIRYIDRYSPNS